MEHQPKGIRLTAMKRELNADEVIAVALLINNFKPQSKTMEFPSFSRKRNHSLIFGSTKENSDDESRISNCLVARKVLLKMESVCPRHLKSLVEEKLIKFVHTKCMQNIGPSTFDDIDVELNEIFPMSESPQLDYDKKTQYMIEVIFKAALVYIRFVQQPEQLANNFESKAAALLSTFSKYTAFQELSFFDEREIEYLLSFWTMTKAALQVIPAKRNKMLLIAICALLEGSGRSYVTGGTQSSATSRRMIIFEQESGIRRACHRAQGTEDDLTKKITTCCCGSTILKRTMWKHVQSKKHEQFITNLAFKKL